MTKRLRTVMELLVRSALVLLLVPMLAPAQSMSVVELREVVGRMVRLHVADAQVAARLRRIQPTEKVSPSLVAEAEQWGAGSLTLRELQNLARKSSSKPETRTLLTSVQGRRGEFEIQGGEAAVVLEAVRMYGEDYSRSIPNFLCYRNTSFLKDNSGLGRWKKHLMLRERLVHLEDGDHHEVVAVDGEEVDGQVMIFHGGLTVSGEFGNVIRRLFQEKTRTRFFWIGEDSGDGEPRVAIAFEVSDENTSMELSSGRDKVKSGYRGELSVSPDTGQIFRVRIGLNETPNGFPIRGASWDIRYASVKVEDQELLLPVSAITEAYQSGAFMRNEATYTDYQKYAAESSIQFGDTIQDISEDEDQ